MERIRKTYSLAFKLKALELSKERDGSVAALARELNINPENIKRWKKDFKSGKLTGIPKEKSAEELELLQLRKERADVKMERDILKKAVSIFSKSDR